MIDKGKIKKWVKQDLIVKDLFREKDLSFDSVLDSVTTEVAVNRAIDLAIEKTLKELEAKNEIGGNLSGGGSIPPASTSEEWSLKGKADYAGHFERMEFVFHYKDIETLRQKLIEDFIGFVDYIGENPEYFADATKKHIEIINKRFGVKE